MFLGLSGLIFLDDVGWVGDDGGRVWSDCWYCWVCAREGAMGERIIKICKKMNILLNKRVV